MKNLREDQHLDYARAFILSMAAEQVNNELPNLDPTDDDVAAIALIASQLEVDVSWIPEGDE